MDILKPFVIALATSLSMFFIIVECARMYPWQTCTGILNSQRTLYEVTLDECVNECVSRPYCGVLGYSRQRKKCGILDSANGHTFRQRNSYILNSSYIAVQRTDIDAPSSICTDGKIQEAGRCVFKECPKPDITNARVFGNMQKIGSKVKIKCLHSNCTPTIATCNDTGGWSNLPICLNNHQAGDEVGFWYPSLSFGSQSLSYADAKQACKADGKYLLKVDTCLKQEWVALYMRTVVPNNTASYWIQGTVEYNGTWVNDDGTPITFFNWNSSQPDGQDCMRMNPAWDYKWGDIECTAAYHFICE